MGEGEGAGQRKAMKAMELNCKEKSCALTALLPSYPFHFIKKKLIVTLIPKITYAQPSPKF